MCRFNSKIANYRNSTIYRHNKENRQGADELTRTKPTNILK